MFFQRSQLYSAEFQETFAPKPPAKNGIPKTLHTSLLVIF